MRSLTTMLALAFMLPACGKNTPSPVHSGTSRPSIGKSMTTFQDDVAFLEGHGEVQILEAEGGARVALSAKYQGRVMTSAVAPTSQSLGWIHREFIAANKHGTAFDNFGGEDRFWLGPEAGQFGLYFPAGKPFSFDLWQTPIALNEGAWTVGFSSKSKVVFTTKMAVDNWSGAKFSLDVERTIRTLGRTDVRTRLGVELQTSVSLVAFESENTIVNTGKEPWLEEKGLLSIWVLGMYAPAEDAHVIVPFSGDMAATEKDPLVNDAYFGKVPAERLVTQPNYLVFTCDGKHRSKIGLGPSRAKDVLGSYSESASLLTIVQYDKPKDATKYVNSMWEMQKSPLKGDVVNSYNDGPTGPGKPSLGGFYELETSSPALALTPGSKATHTQRTYHFVGDKTALSAIAKKVLGATLK